MKIDMLGVQAFVAVAEHLSFRRAAEALSITQTALSRRLKNLEAYLGVKLVERTTRSVALSRLGETFLPQARRQLADLTAALTEIRETGKALRGDVTLACVPTIGVHYLPRILGLYSARFPQNRVTVLDHTSAGVFESVLRREAELGINFAEARHPAMESVPLVDDEFVAVCRVDDALHRRRRIAWGELRGRRLILPGVGSSNRPLLEHALGEGGVEVAAFYEVQRSSTAVGLAAAGVGVAIVPRLALQAGAYPKLRMVALTSPKVTRRFCLLTRRGAELSPAARTLQAMIMGQVRRPAG